MKIGDLVRKKTGMEEGEIGVIVNMTTNSYENGDPVTILTVISKKVIVNWYASYVEVINESR